MVNNLHQSINPSGAPVAVTPTTPSITSTRHPSLHTAPARQPATLQASPHRHSFPLPLSSRSNPSHPPLPFGFNLPSLSLHPTRHLPHPPYQVARTQAFTPFSSPPSKTPLQFLSLQLPSNYSPPSLSFHPLVTKTHVHPLTVPASQSSTFHSNPLISYLPTVPISIPSPPFRL